MTRNPPRSAKSNAGDRKGVSENAPRDALNGRIGLFGRAIRPARSTTRGPETEIAWKVAFGRVSVKGGKRNGECRLMSQDSKTVLVWTYEPHNFFEEEVLIVWLGGEITITDGSVRGTFDSKYYSEGIDFRDKVHDVVHSHFHAQQVQIQTSFELSPASMSREHADGRRDATVFVETMRLQLTGFPIDIVTRDAKGNVVTDTRAVRINKQKKFGGDVLRLLPNDPTLKQLLQSFDNALRDKDNILIHLYEIREAISVEYGGEANAIAATNVTKTKWSRFGQMANNDPLLEGRHRGKHTNLRNSTEEEISFAKDFAKTLVEGYVANKVGKIT